MKTVRSILRKLIELFILLIVGGSIYYTLELMFRGYSHSSMFLVGGICFILIGIINEFYSWNLAIEWQTLIGLSIVITVEFISGCILNLWLGLNIWDYSDLPFNLLGQICLPFALLWLPLCVLAILLDDCLRYKWFEEEKPRYKSLVIEKIKSLKK